MEYAPIALFVYNRLLHTQNTVQALKSNPLSSETNLIIFSDGPRSSEQSKKVESVRSFIKSIDGFKSIKIVERDCNYGLANSIIDGVTKVCSEFGKVIVLEDDIVTSNYFLTYMNDALNHYKNNKKVASIHGYIYPTQGLPETFFLRGADCWGWATWNEKWELFNSDGAQLLDGLKKQKLLKRFDFNGSYPYSRMLEDQIAGKNDSWAIRWHASAFLNNLYTLYPGKSLVENIGNDGSGTHFSNTDIFTSRVSDQKINNFPINVEDDLVALRLIEKYFKTQKNRSMNILRRIKRKLGL
ncbi:glycosyltransferase family 2 protein [Methylophilus aquaticus]|uniref:Glycosyltransferase family 2 protein n=1 Tax=Methylophilus aquaticus TaxID=1971610 RepID=A0ABT9JUF9_9PROT|nr:glycosyltransferase family 2 protein [Methylophilus aquaticus]MDP8568089.1 glycosyltransferase family 2 protein [Methylophilus aquaticus]